MFTIMLVARKPNRETISAYLILSFLKKLYEYGKKISNLSDNISYLLDLNGIIIIIIQNKIQSLYTQIEDS